MRAARQQSEDSAKNSVTPSPQLTPKSDEPINLTDPELRQMRRSQREGYSQSYNCQAVVDAVFGVIKAVLGFRQFLLRGLEKASREWTLVWLAYNLRRLHRLCAALAG